jgi:hypothetical protein
MTGRSSDLSGQPIFGAHKRNSPGAVDFAPRFAYHGLVLSMGVPYSRASPAACVRAAGPGEHAKRTACPCGGPTPAR